MIKNIIFATIIAITAPVCAQETTTIRNGRRFFSVKFARI